MEIQAIREFQLTAIFEETSYSSIIIEHNPLLHKDAKGMIDSVLLEMSDAAKEGCHSAKRAGILPKTRSILK